MEWPPRRLRLFAHVDGFNLYYAVLKDTPHRWLDLRKLFKTLFPDCEISAIKYFTALVSGRPDDQDQPIRQQVYLRALRTLPGMQVVLGTFLRQRL